MTFLVGQGDCRAVEVCLANRDSAVLADNAVGHSLDAVESEEGRSRCRSGVINLRGVVGVDCIAFAVSRAVVGGLGCAFCHFVEGSRCRLCRFVLFVESQLEGLTFLVGQGDCRAVEVCLANRDSAVLADNAVGHSLDAVESEEGRSRCRSGVINLRGVVGVDCIAFAVSRAVVGGLGCAFCHFVEGSRCRLCRLVLFIESKLEGLTFLVRQGDRRAVEVGLAKFDRAILADNVIGHSLDAVESEESRSRRRSSVINLGGVVRVDRVAFAVSSAVVSGFGRARCHFVEGSRSSLGGLVLFIESQLVGLTFLVRQGDRRAVEVCLAKRDRAVRADDFIGHSLDAFDVEERNNLGICGLERVSGVGRFFVPLGGDFRLAVGGLGVCQFTESSAGFLSSRFLGGHAVECQRVILVVDADVFAVESRRRNREGLVSACDCFKRCAFAQAGELDVFRAHRFVGDGVIGDCGIEAGLADARRRVGTCLEFVCGLFIRGRSVTFSELQGDSARRKSRLAVFERTNLERYVSGSGLITEYAFADSHDTVRVGDCVDFDCLLGCVCGVELDTALEGHGINRRTIDEGSFVGGIDLVARGLRAGALVGVARVALCQACLLLADRSNSRIDNQFGVNAVGARRNLERAVVGVAGGREGFGGVNRDCAVGRIGREVLDERCSFSFHDADVALEVDLLGHGVVGEVSIVAALVDETVLFLRAAEHVGVGACAGIRVGRVFRKRQRAVVFAAVERLVNRQFISRSIGEHERVAHSARAAERT